MAEAKKVSGAPAGVTPPHDRVVGLSLRSDGTPDQNNPEIIGDKAAAVEATKRQFAEFAVSAVDQEVRRAAGLGGAEEGSTADAAIDQVKAEHEKVAAAAEKSAEALVEQLHQGDTGTAAPAPPAGGSGK